MGKQKSFFSFIGKAGNVIGYERNGKFFLRAAPEHVEQTAATRRAAKSFGRHSRKAKLVRHAFYTDLDVRCDSTHINRLNKVLINAAGDHMAIKGFRFNQDAGIDRFFALSPEVSKNGALHIPAQEIARHKGITALEVKAIAVRIDFNTRRITGTDTVDLIIDPRQPFAGATIPLYVAGEGTLMLTLQVKGLHQDGPSGNRQYQAADVIAVIPPRKPKRVKIHPHPQRSMEQSPVSVPPFTTNTYQPITQRE